MLTNPILKKVARTIEEHRLFHVGDTVVVAVSGGADSVALLDILVSLGGLRLNLLVAHMNHMLRGAESDGDAEFTGELAAGYGLPFELVATDVRGICRERRLSLEEAGRAARYEWLDALAARYGARSVALGHHADDQAETFLLRLLRGAGTTGLSGMKPLSAGRYARPLLFLTRDEILGYVESKGLGYRHDSSNDATDFLRNRIRHECIPYLRSYNPAISELLSNSAEILAADEAVLEKVVDQAFDRHCRIAFPGVSLQVDGVQNELPGVRLRLYRRALRIVKGDLSRVAGTHLKQIDRLTFSGSPNSSLTLPDRLTVVRCYGKLIFSVAETDARVWEGELTVPGPGIYSLPDGRTLAISIVPAPAGQVSCCPGRAYFDPRSVRFPLTVRTFRPGDRFRPFGMQGTKKVKDFFIDSKIPARVRRGIPLLFSGDELLWVCGFRVSETGRISPGTPEVLEVEIPEITP